MRMEYREMLQKDRLYDGKSLLYEEGILQEVEDDRDTDRIPEGRLGEFRVKRVIASIGVPFFLPLIGRNFDENEIEEVIDEESVYQLRTSTRYIKLLKAEIPEAGKMQNDYENDEKWVEIKKTKENKKGKQLYGFVDIESDKSMVGIVDFIESSEKLVYILIYAGIGNFTDIRMEQNNIRNSIYKRVM